MRFHGTDGEYLPFFQNPEQQELGGTGREVDLVEEQGTPV
jgi:hypothetical protein